LSGLSDFDLLSVAMNIQTLSQRLAESRIPVSDALRYCMILAEALRKLHDGGGVHGDICPETVALTGTGVELLPARTGVCHGAYTAPEVIQGRAADSLSDIFSFGSVVFELLSGKRVFEGLDRSAMTLSGSPALDRLVASCVAPEPANRVQRIQKIMLELKLLSVSVSRSTPVAAARADAQLREDVQEMEARITARLDGFEEIMAELQRVVSQSLNRESTLEATLRSEIVLMGSRMGKRLEGCEKRITDLEAAVDALRERPASVPDPMLRDDLQNMEARVSGRMESFENQTSALEMSVEGVRAHVDELHELVAQDLINIERTLHSHADALDASRTAMTQTDDLVERVVEALETLQTTVIDNSGGRALAVA
jgi:serine/threonine protein kinase